MATGSSVSHHWDPKRLRLDLPLIACGECKQKIVKEYRVKKRESTRVVYSTSVRTIRWVIISQHLINMVNLSWFCLMLLF